MQVPFSTELGRVIWGGIIISPVAPLDLRHRILHARWTCHRLRGMPA
jgi:hypothetical protein